MMSSHSSILERYRLQTYSLPPDKVMHLLSPEQTGDANAQVLYKKQSGSAGQLGGGSFGTVHLEYQDSECAAVPHVRAVKTISKAIADKNSVHWQQEIENLITLSKFPELFVQVFGWWEDDKSIYLPMEYFEAGDLSRCKELIRGENDIRAISYQIALGLQKMHALDIIHRDLKPQNVLVAAQRPTWKVKIGDFGGSKRISESVSAPFSVRGTTRYLAPEYSDPWNNRESSDITAAVDMWSFGCLIYELFAHKCPFEEEDSNSLKRYIKDKVFPRQPLDRRGASSESIWLISKLLDPDPDLRLSGEDALKYAWFDVESTPAQQIADLLTSVEHLTVNSQLRRQPSVESLGSTPDATPRLQAAIEPAPPAFIVSVAADDKDETTVSSYQSLHRPELPDRVATVPTVTVDQIALVPDKSIQKPSLPPRLPPRLPSRPNSSNSLRADAEKTNVKPHFVILPHKDPDTSAVEVEVIKPDSIEMPRSSSPMPAKSRTTRGLAPSLRSTKREDDHVEMDFKDLPFAIKPKPMCDICEARRVFNPIIKPAALYICKDCSCRPLCARCIIESIRSTADPHEADHKLQAWIQGHRFPFASFLKHFPTMTTTQSGLEAEYGPSWLSSDHAFIPPAGGQLTTRFTMHAPPGEYTVCVDIRTLKYGEAMRSSTIGHVKAMMVKKAKAVKLGSILVGAQAVEMLNIPAEEDIAHNRYLPEGPKEYEVTLTEEEHPQTIKLGRSVRVDTGHLLEVHIRGSYDSAFFTAGSPFRWWLDEISIEHMGPEEHVASMGDRKMREKFKEQQERLLHDKKIQKNMGLLSQSIDVAGKIGGRFMPGAKFLSTVASGGVKLSASAMKDSQGRIEGLHSAPQVVHNHYVLMNDAPSHQQEQQQEQQQAPEYEVEEQEPEEPVDQGFYALQVEYQEQVEYYQVEEGQRQLMGEAESVHT